MMNTPMVHAPEVIAAYGRCAEEMVRRRDEQCPMGRMSDAWDVAFAALFLASDEAKYIGTELGEAASSWGDAASSLSTSSTRSLRDRVSQP
jgi:NAD(P)-dependent dehydrogenase (short-subunit alcohol dehydrogenase family)